MMKKEIAIHFLKLAASGHSREAFRLYVSENFKHHNAYFRGDRHSLMVAMEENAESNPNKILEIQRALEDGDLVAVHSCIKNSGAQNDVAVMHIFRFDGDKIEELWDFGQKVPDDIVNENGMF